MNPTTQPDRLLIFGGTFDPPHRAHRTMALRAREAWERLAGGPVRLLIVPAARSPHKDEAPRATDADRLAMLTLAWRGVDGADGADVWPGEIERAARVEGPSYTIDTVRALSAPGVELALVIGSDQAGAFHRWREARELFARARPWIVPRGEVHDRAALRHALEAAGFWTRDELDLWADRWVDAPIDPASSTVVRAELARREPDGALLESLLGPEVWSFIRARGLYRPRGS
jgi:nicotinate-nucleotide adenylyltransferase